MAPTPVPERVALRMYQVGFGDCFVLSFYYDQPLDDGRAERHVLIDFGSTHRPKGADRDLLADVAALIEQHTSGRLDAVVVTHRHRDHLSGFADSVAAETITRLNPQLVVRPWTERPDLPRDATAPLPDDDDGRHLAAVRLAAGQSLAERVRELVDGARSVTLPGELAELAADQLPNREAIEFLDALASRTHGEYLAAGHTTRLEALIPGIRVHVLGPPTIEQQPDLVKARSRDPSEFWMLHAGALEATTAQDLDLRIPATPSGLEPGPMAWLVNRLTRQRVSSLLRIVRSVDDALNNTSLILLIEVGDKRLLLPGDAQIENWSYALFSQDEDAKAWRELLARVDLYKVGHHGSRNATPRSLFRFWGEAPDDQRPMVSLLSTMGDVHGRTPATAVPRATLLEALGRRTELLRTDAPEDAPAYIAVQAGTSGGEPFREMPPT